MIEKIEKDLEEGIFRSRLAAIRHYLSEIEGPTDDAKIRRIQRKLADRLQGNDDSLVEVLADFDSPEAAADYVADLDEKFEHAWNFATRAMRRLRERGSEQGRERQFFKDFLVAGFRDYDKSKKGD